jgi:hypothetical protein
MFGKTEQQCNVRISPLPAAFRYETELAAPAERLFRHRAGRWDFAHELHALRAAPDLVAGRRSIAFDQRCQLGPEPITTALELRLLEFAAAGATNDELRAWAPWGWRDLRKRALEPANARGLIELVDDTWQSVTAPSAYEELLAIELKLRDWPKGIRQARANLAFASESWLVMPTPVPLEAVALAKRVKVGLAAVDEDGGAKELTAAVKQEPASPFAARFYRELVLEQALEQRLPGAQELRPLAGSPRGRKLVVGV